MLGSWVPDRDVQRAGYRPRAIVWPPLGSMMDSAFSFFRKTLTLCCKWRTLQLSCALGLFVFVSVSAAGNSRLFEFLHRLLGPEHKLQRNVFAVTVRPPAGADNVLRHFLQRGRADGPRMAQSGHDLVLQQPADLKRITNNRPQRESKNGSSRGANSKQIEQ